MDKIGARDYDTQSTFFLGRTREEVYMPVPRINQEQKTFPCLIEVFRAYWTQCSYFCVNPSNAEKTTLCLFIRFHPCRSDLVKWERDRTTSGVEPMPVDLPTDLWNLHSFTDHKIVISPWYVARTCIIWSCLIISNLTTQPLVPNLGIITKRRLMLFPGT